MSPEPAGAPPIGAHLWLDASMLEGAADRDADAVQFFLGDPQDWRIPEPGPLAAEVAASPLVKYVHAPYVMNLASANNRIRIPSRKLLADTCAGAAKVGASAVIVHGGHVTRSDDVGEGFDRWRKALERLESPVQVLLENTAGGDHAMARRLDTLGRLWDVIGGFGLGFCLDTCHFHAAGEDLATIVDKVSAITGRIDLVHCNDSKDPAGSGRDRHENLGYGTINLELLVGVARDASAPVIVETPGGDVEHGAEIKLLRSRLDA